MGPEDEGRAARPPEPTLEDLEAARREHVRDLRRIEKMTAAQFEAFKRNFELGRMDPRLTRAEAMGILKSMICTNLGIQQERRGARGVAKRGPGCYPGPASGRE